MQPMEGQRLMEKELDELQAPILRKRKEEPSSMGYRGGFRGEEEVEPMAHDIMGLLPSSWIFFCLSSLRYTRFAQYEIHFCYAV